VSIKRVILIALLVLLLVFLVLLPRVATKDSTINLAVLVLLYATLASSWNILGGYTGQTNLGHAALFGLGSLVARLLWLSAGWPLLPSLLAGGMVAVAFGLLIGIPAFRLRGVYFAIGTLALGQILYVTVGNEFPTITSLPAQYLVTYELVPRYYLFLVLALLTVGIAYLLVHSRPGLGMMAVREEEEAAESLGVSALRHKLLSLGISAFLAGLAGGAFAYYHVSYYPQFPFGPIWTFDAVMITYIGGAGTLVGPVIGAVFFVIARELLALKLVELHLVVFGTLFILVVLFLPGGFVEAWHKIQQAFSRRSRSKEPEAMPQDMEG
jgi:branched-chain amino acid transport system permease protein